MLSPFMRAKTAQKLSFFLIISSLAFSSAYAQSKKDFAIYLEDSRFTATEKLAIEQDLFRILKGNKSGITELKGLQGNNSSSAFCISGYAKKADYTFSSTGIKVAKQAGINCNGQGQCRGIQTDITPDDPSKPYDFSMRLQCSADDTIPRLSRSELSGTQTLNTKK